MGKQTYESNGYVDLPTPKHEDLQLDGEPVDHKLGQLVLAAVAIAGIDQLDQN